MPWFSATSKYQISFKVCVCRKIYCKILWAIVSSQSWTFNWKFCLKWCSSYHYNCQENGGWRCEALGDRSFLGCWAQEDGWYNYGKVAEHVYFCALSWKCFGICMHLCVDVDSICPSWGLQKPVSDNSLKMLVQIVLIILPISLHHKRQNPWFRKDVSKFALGEDVLLDYLDS